jgi:hypothetical protein
MALDIAKYAQLELGAQTQTPATVVSALQGHLPWMDHVNACHAQQGVIQYPGDQAHASIASRGPTLAIGTPHLAHYAQTAEQQMAMEKHLATSTSSPPIWKQGKSRE